MATLFDDLSVLAFASVTLTDTTRGGETLPNLVGSATVTIDDDVRAAETPPSLLGAASVTLEPTVAVSTDLSLLGAASVTLEPTLVPNDDLSLLAAASVTLEDQVTGDNVDLLGTASITLEETLVGDNLDLLAVASLTLDLATSQAFLRPYLGICSPPFTPTPCAQACPPTPETLVITALLAPLLEQRARRRRPMGPVVGPGVLTLPPVPTCGPAFTPVPCPPQWPADPAPYLPPPIVTTCHAPLGLFQLGHTCLGADAGVIGAEDLVLLAAASVTLEDRAPAEEDLVLLAAASIEVS